MIFPVVLSRKMIFLFPKSMILFFRRKMKDDISQKIHGNIIFSSNASKTWSFKKNRARLWSFLNIWKDGIFFRKIWYFFFRRKMKDDLSQEMHGDMIFSVYRYKCYKYDIILLQKKSKMILSRKNTLKANWHSKSHSRKSSNYSLYFYGDHHRRFHILLSSEKKIRKFNI